MTNFEKKNNPAELNEDELEMVSGGEYGDLLRPILTTYKASAPADIRRLSKAAAMEGLSVRNAIS